MMKVTKKDILSIEPGTSMTFKLPDWDSCKSAQSYIYQINYSRDKPRNVNRYKTSLNAEECKLTIEAIKR